MYKTISVVNTGHMNGTTTQQGLSQSFDIDNETSAAIEPGYSASVSQPLVAVDVTQSLVSTSYNPFSIDSILQRGPPSSACRPWSTDVEVHSWNEVISRTAATHHSSISHRHLSQSAWSCGWHANYIGTTTAQQFAYPAVNVHVTGEIIILHNMKYILGHELFYYTLHLFGVKSVSECDCDCVYSSFIFLTAHQHILGHFVLIVLCDLILNT